MTLEQCTKNYNHMRLGNGDMAWDKQTNYFGPNFALYPPAGALTIKNFKKQKKQRDIILHQCTENGDNLMFGRRKVMTREKHTIFLLLPS